MKRLFGLAVLGLALMAVPVHAEGCCGPGYVNFGIKFYWHWGSCKAVVGPWYNYWPLEAHFQVPAHPQYPFWPAPMTLPNGAPAAVPNVPVAAAGPGPAMYNAPPHPGYAGFQGYPGYATH
jgi:hypothetical protein